MNNTSIDYGTAILPTELDFVKEVTHPGDEFYLPETTAEKTLFKKAKILKTYTNIVQTTIGTKTWVDIVMGYRYTVNRQNRSNSNVY